MTSLYGVILAVTAFISLAMANHCDVTDTLNNQWVNVNQMKNDHDPRYLSETQVSSQEDCQKACCLNDACTVVIYDAKINQSSTNCVLLTCSSDQKCVFEDKDDKVAYIIDKKHDDIAQNVTTAAKTTTTPLPSVKDKQGSAALPAPSAVASQTATTTTTVAQNARLTKAGTLASSLTNASSTVASPSSNGHKTSTTTTPSLSSTLFLTTTKSSLLNSTAQKSLTLPTDVGYEQEQNTSKINVQNQTTSVNVDDLNNSSKDSNTEEAAQETNLTMSKLLSEEDISRLLNITEPSIEVNNLQIKPPPTTTQPFVRLLSSSTPSSSSSSSSSSSKTPPPSLTTTTTTSSSSSSPQPQPQPPPPPSSSSSSKTPPQSLTTTSSSSPPPQPPPLTSSSSSSMTTTSTIKLATTISTISTNPSGLHLMNTSTDVTNMKSNNTKQHNITEGVTKNVTNSRLDNVEEQTAPSSAMFGGLIALVCFGFFFVLAITAIFGKKLFESWQRRHYSRIDYLVNGMYN